MRGNDEQTGHLFSYLSPDERRAAMDELLAPCSAEDLEAPGRTVYFSREYLNRTAYSLFSSTARFIKSSSLAVIGRRRFAAS